MLESYDNQTSWNKFLSQICFGLHIAPPPSYIVSYPETLRAFLLEAHNKFKLFKSFVSSYVWHKTNTAFYKKKIMPTVKQDGVSVMVWGCFIASGLG